jgi:hypothetical protein
VDILDSRTSTPAPASSDLLIVLRQTGWVPTNRPGSTNGIEHISREKSTLRICRLRVEVADRAQNGLWETAKVGWVDHGLTGQPPRLSL